MKSLLLFMAIALSFTCVQAQEKMHGYNSRITEVEGTEYIIVFTSVESKKIILKNTKTKYVLFINTSTGDTTRVDMDPKTEGVSFNRIKIDNLGIDKILITAHRNELTSMKMYGNDITDCLLCSIDGKDRKKLNRENYIVKDWKVNNKTGTIVLNGYDLQEKKTTDHHRDVLFLYSIKEMKAITAIEID